MLRSGLLALSTNEGIRHLATRSSLGKRLASRFVAGETIDEAIAATQELNVRGASVELDYLGEHVADLAQTGVAVSNYLDMLARIAGANIEAQVSVKPSQMGQELDDDLCYINFCRVLERAGEHENFVWMDMESSDFTERTLQLYTKLRARFNNIGLALQAYLYRCRADVEAISSIVGTVRLVKGAYNEPHHVAFPRKRDVDDNFALLTEALLSSKQFHAIATHDEKMINHAIEFAKANGLSPQGFEFQMLYGIRRDLQIRLLQGGYRLRVYVPYGEQWYPYLMRRMAERPANLLFMVKNVATEVWAR